MLTSVTVFNAVQRITWVPNPWIQKAQRVAEFFPSHLTPGSLLQSVRAWPCILKNDNSVRLVAYNLLDENSWGQVLVGFSQPEFSNNWYANMGKKYVGRTHTGTGGWADLSGQVEQAQALRGTLRNGSLEAWDILSSPVCVSLTQCLSVCLLFKGPLHSGSSFLSIFISEQKKVVLQLRR